MAGKRVLGIVLAGGAGKGLAPLTAERAKAAVPFGGVYRVVDFALSNLVNGGIRRICVLTQYKSHSLDKHLATAWRLSSLLGDHVAPVPAQWLTQAVVPYLRDRGSGSIEHVAARPGLEPTAGMATAAVSKAAPAYLTRVLDLELRPLGIRVNAAAPVSGAIVPA